MIVDKNGDEDSELNEELNTFFEQQGDTLIKNLVQNLLGLAKAIHENPSDQEHGPVFATLAAVSLATIQNDIHHLSKKVDALFNLYADSEGNLPDVKSTSNDNN